MNENMDRSTSLDGFGTARIVITFFDQIFRKEEMGIKGIYSSSLFSWRPRRYRRPYHYRKNEAKPLPNFIQFDSITKTQLN